MVVEHWINLLSEEFKQIKINPKILCIYLIHTVIGLRGFIWNKIYLDQTQQNNSLKKQLQMKWTKK